MGSLIGQVECIYVENEMLEMIEGGVPILIDWYTILTWQGWLTIGALTNAFIIIYAAKQLREMNRSTFAQTFSIITSYLQSKECRDARRVLMNLNGNDFTKWKDIQKDKAELTGSVYDVIAIMLERKKVIDPDIIIGEWRDSIIKCWEHAQPMIKYYREVEKRGQDY